MTKAEALEIAADYAARAAKELETYSKFVVIFGADDETSRSVYSLMIRYLENQRHYEWLARLHPSTRAAVLRRAVNV
jgi:hypothetical protein